MLAKGIRAASSCRTVSSSTGSKAENRGMEVRSPATRPTTRSAARHLHRKTARRSRIDRDNAERAIIGNRGIALEHDVLADVDVGRADRTRNIYRHGGDRDRCAGDRPGALREGRGAGAYWRARPRTEGDNAGILAQPLNAPMLVRDHNRGRPYSGTVPVGIVSARRSVHIDCRTS